MFILWSYKGWPAALVFIFLTGAPGYAQLSTEPCRFSGEQARCGQLSVPENRKTPEGRQISLRLMVLSKTGGAPPGEPLFVLNGGPGTSAVDWAESLIFGLADVRRSRDIVFLDQRGAGGSNRLFCQVADRSFVVPRDPERCLARLNAKADLRAYTTSDFIEDIESARLALGYEQISLYGLSYGTWAAYAYARRFPNRVRSLILIAPAPISMNFFDSFEEDGRRALEALVVDCRSDPACSKAFPTLGADAQKVRRELTEPFYALGLQFLQYSSATSRFIPLLVSRAAAGDREPLDQKINEFRKQFIEWLSIGPHLAVACNEDVPFGLKQGRPGASRALRTEYERACRGWPRVDLPAGFYKASRINSPALIITGEWDPVTPPRLARMAAEQFSRSQVVVVPRSGHMLDGAEACIGRLATEFLDHGSAGTSCIAEIRRPPYVLRLE